jgi:hypothetical protein
MGESIVPSAAMQCFLDREDEGERRLRHGLDVHRTVGARYLAARNAINLGEALLQRGPRSPTTQK